MNIRKAGETRFIKSDLLEEGLVFIDAKSINNSFRKLDRIAILVCSKLKIEPLNIVTEQNLTNNGMLFTIRDESKVSEEELYDMLKSIYINSRS